MLITYSSEKLLTKERGSSWLTVVEGPLLRSSGPSVLAIWRGQTLSVVECVQRKVSQEAEGAAGPDQGCCNQPSAKSSIVRSAF